MPERATIPEGALDGCRWVLYGFTDVHGSLRGKALARADFERVVEEGHAKLTDLLLALDPLDVPVTDHTTIGILGGARDLRLVPQLETLAPLPWRPGWAVCLGTPAWDDGRPCELVPRNVAAHALTRLGEHGLHATAAFEYEVRLTDASSGAPPSAGISYSAHELARYAPLMDELAEALSGLGIVAQAMHTEAGPGLFELNVAPADGLRAADEAALARFALREVAERHGLDVSFLAKPRAGEEGSSGHVHLSLRSEAGPALTLAPDSEGVSATERLDPVLRDVVAGLLAHLPAASLIHNPTINSYKRLVPGWFAPVNATWGIENRSAAVRVIGPAAGGPSRVECRRPGADANPYLVLAALVASAQLGIAQHPELPPPASGDASAEEVDLPGSLEAALATFERDAALRSALGDAFADYYAVSRRWELRAWQQAVTDWERARYRACG